MSSGYTEAERLAAEWRRQQKLKDQEERSKESKYRRSNRDSLTKKADEILQRIQHKEQHETKRLEEKREDLKRRDNDVDEFGRIINPNSTRFSGDRSGNSRSKSRERYYGRERRSRSRSNSRRSNRRRDRSRSRSWNRRSRDIHDEPKWKHDKFYEVNQDSETDDEKRYLHQTFEYK